MKKLLCALIAAMGCVGCARHGDLHKKLGHQEAIRYLQMIQKYHETKYYQSSDASVKKAHLDTIRYIQISTVAMCDTFNKER
jgi:hypothetical protein